MKNGIMPKDLFKILDQIKDANDIIDTQWADAAWGKKTKQSRISEIRTNKTGRAFSYGKYLMLLEGLQKLIGEDVLNKELLKRLEKTKTDKEKILLLISALPKNDEKQVLLYLSAVVDKVKK